MIDFQNVNYLLFFLWKVRSLLKVFFHAKADRLALLLPTRPLGRLTVHRQCWLRQPLKWFKASETKVN